MQRRSFLSALIVPALQISALPTSTPAAEPATIDGTGRGARRQRNILRGWILTVAVPACRAAGDFNWRAIADAGFIVGLTGPYSLSKARREAKAFNRSPDRGHHWAIVACTDGRKGGAV